MNLAGILEAAFKDRRWLIYRGLGDESNLLRDMTVLSVSVKGDGMIVLHGASGYVKLYPSPDLRFVEVVAQIKEIEPQKVVTKTADKPAVHPSPGPPRPTKTKK